MPRRVDVYEVSRRVVTTDVDWIEFHRFVGGTLKDWQEVPDHKNETARFVKHRAPVLMLREDGRPDAYVAIGPELFELLAPAVDAGLRNLCTGLSAANKGLLAERDIAIVSRARAESDAAAQSAVSQHMSQRIGNFREANVLRRVWRAIWLRL